MNIWFALLIPLIITGITWYFWKKHISILEIFLPTLIVAISILIFKYFSTMGKTQDIEYWGSLIVKVEYYEYWETWVEETCVETYSCNCDKDGCQTCTRIVDCSYCDKNREKYIAYDNIGNSWGISEKKYKELIKKWKATPKFVELNRNIDYNIWGCGEDGDMYYIEWNKDILTSEPSVTKHSYENKVQATNSAYSYEKISKKQAKQIGLYDYPELYNYWRQKNILGLDSLHIGNKNKISQKFEYWNGYHGPTDKVKVFILLFYTKDPLIAYSQEAYWVGGNKNELVICIGIDKNTSEIWWVRPFSWSDNKRVIVDAREEISNMKTLDFDLLYNKLNYIVEDKFQYKNFDDFEYLKVEIPKWCYWVVFILSILISIGVNYISVINYNDKDYD